MYPVVLRFLFRILSNYCTILPRFVPFLKGGGKKSESRRTLEWPKQSTKPCPRAGLFILALDFLTTKGAKVPLKAVVHSQAFYLN